MRFYCFWLYPRIFNPWCSVLCALLRYSMDMSFHNLVGFYNYPMDRKTNPLQKLCFRGDRGGPKRRCGQYLSSHCGPPSVPWFRILGYYIYLLIPWIIKLFWMVLSPRPWRLTQGFHLALGVDPFSLWRVPRRGRLRWWEVNSALLFEAWAPLAKCVRYWGWVLYGYWALEFSASWNAKPIKYRLARDSYFS